MVCSLPNEIQQVICNIVLKQTQSNTAQLFQLLIVNKLWAHFVCSYLYRDYTCKKYVNFIHFYNTVISKKKILPYGKYIQRLDLTAINKYGIDTRAHELLRHCTNITSVTLGHPTSIKPKTIRWMATHCPSLRTLSIGALESFPFMLECDFSSLKGLTSVSFTTTPLLPSSFLTLPTSLTELHLTKMESLTNQDMMMQFFKHHPSIHTLSLIQCTKLFLLLFLNHNDDDDHHSWSPLQQLKIFHLSDTNVQDQHLLSILKWKGALNVFILENTQISSKLIQTIYRHDYHYHHNLPLLVQEWKFINNINR